jgi:hypothetical protein
VADTANPSAPSPIGAEEPRKSPALFDATLITLGSALVAAAVVAHGNGFRLVTWLAGAATAAVAVIAALVASRGNRGVFLTPTWRVLLLIAAAGSFGVLARVSPVPQSSPAARAGPDPASNAAMFNLQLEKASLEGRLAAKTGEAEELRTANQKTGKERDEALQRADDHRIEADRLREQEREQREKQKAQVQPPAAPKSDPQTEKQLLAKAWNIPEEQVESQRQVFERNPFGRNVVEAILGKAPLIGPALGGLFGGGRVRAVTVRVVETLQGGTIPAATDLTNMFLATDNPADLTADLYALIDRGEARSVISKENADKMKREIETIRNAAALPVSSDAQKARDTITQALAAGKTCSINLTSPNFVKFASIAEKRKLIATTTDEVTKSCLEQYPATGSTPTQ